ncbi:site-specific DNA-methyltransferase [Peribacillus frigoritolerans]|uniref:site-specific DNA-methyltransferase n=1 Tax=Peribacillus frigoritolerans TaxID=450367 RepID=UPI0022810248|nr:site-specific DNA-methyltransferase [Peribacillus frigoritolerans]MCY9002863.1 site-specific DNA-methyltransferase [Peribacillus frigoritolerans]
MIKETLDNNENRKLNERKLSILKENFPNCFSGDTFDIEKFKKEINQDVDFASEGYELNFLGKNYAKYIADSIDTETVLTPNIENNNQEENSKSDNIYITGDNLDVLKHLRKSYTNQVKMIYIDPPYNTGGDGFVYSDNFKFTKEKLRSVLDIEEEEAERILNMTSSKSSSHSAWLTFIYPRIYIAGELLKDDGVIFISIDENEHSQLKILCDDIFGEQNFAGEIIWKNSSKNDQAYISMQHEYILCYVKNKKYNSGAWKEKKEGLEEIYKAFETFREKHDDDWDAIHKEALKWYKQFPESNPIYSSKHYSWMDDIKGVYFPDNISGPNFGQYRYDVIHPITGKVCKEPSSGWRYPETTMKQRIEDGLVHFGKDETTVPNNKTYLKDTEFQSLTSIKYKDGRVASKNLKKLLEGNIFTNPKDVDLLASIMKVININDNDIVLDFFSGSGTTAHAVMKLNAEDNGKRKYIMVQLDESVKVGSEAEKSGYKTIDEIGRERIIRASKLIYEERGADIDYGFKHYYAITLNDNKIDEIKEFDPNLLVSELEVEFDKETILTTWMNRDGHGLTPTITEVDLAGFIAYSVNGYLYLVDKGLTQQNIDLLLSKIVEEKDFNPTNVVIYGYNFKDFNVLTQLEVNLKQLKNEEKNIEISLIKRY